MKKIIIICILAIIGLTIYSCEGGNMNSGIPVPPDTPDSGTATKGNTSYDPKRGEGNFKQVEVKSTLDATLVNTGNKVYSTKCQSCHKLSDEKFIGPGWKGVTSRHTPEWIMNFITNTVAMLNKDPDAQAQLKLYQVRMPNQNVSDDDARAIYEFLRKNDGVK